MAEASRRNFPACKIYWDILGTVTGMHMLLQKYLQLCKIYRTVGNYLLDRENAGMGCGCICCYNSAMYICKIYMDKYSNYLLDIKKYRDGLWMHTPLQKLR